MAYTEQIVLTQFINAHKEIEVCRKTITSKDGVVIAQTDHWDVYAPGADVSGEDATVQAIAAAIWTPEVLADYATWKAQIAAEQAARMAEIAARVA